MNQEIIISNSQCLYRVMAEDIVYVEADGNYCHIVLTGGQDVMLTLQIGKLAELIEQQLCSSMSPLAKIGRSLIVNLHCIYFMNPQKQQLVLRDSHGKTSRTLSAPTSALRGMKEAMDAALQARLMPSITPESNEENENPTTTDN